MPPFGIGKVYLKNIFQKLSEPGLVYDLNTPIDNYDCYLKLRQTLEALKSSIDKISNTVSAIAISVDVGELNAKGKRKDIQQEYVHRELKSLRFSNRRLIRSGSDRSADDIAICPLCIYVAQEVSFNVNVDSPGSSKIPSGGSARFILGCGCRKSPVRFKKYPESIQVIETMRKILFGIAADKFHKDRLTARRNK